MKFMVSVHHPAWAHQLKNVIKILEKRGHQVKVLAIRREKNLELLQSFGIDFTLIARSTGSNFFNKAFIFVSTTLKTIVLSLNFKPDFYIGRASPMMAIASFLFRKPHILFEDTEHSKFSLFFCRLFSSVIITPDSFRYDLGKKHIRINTYKELFYLHPNYFVPNPSILEEVGLSEEEPFIIIRFISWAASHDFGHSGLTPDSRAKVVREMEKYGRIFITSERPLEPEFEKYRLTLPFEKIHHLMYYATLVYGESATMASEAAVLGTHAIFCDFTGRGYTDEQEKKYNLVFNFKLGEEAQEESIKKGIQLVETKGLWKMGKEKRKALLDDKIDGTQYMLATIDRIVKERAG